MVKYSSRAALALAFLKRPYNDVDIFVEDTSNHNLWLHVIRKLLRAGLRIASVNMLGGRIEVLEACKLDQSDTKRRRLYIIDGDFDLLTGAKKPRLKYLYRLRAYCIENLLICEQGLINCGMLYGPNKTEAQLASRFDYQNWSDTIGRYLSKIFVVYAVARIADEDIQTVGFSVRRLLRQIDGTPEICPIKVASHVGNVRRQIIEKIGMAEYKIIREKIFKNSAAMSPIMYISGKDYIWPLLHIRMQKTLNYQGSFDVLKVQLASYWNGLADPYLRRRLQTI